MTLQRESRVVSLPGTGVLGTLYIVEPGKGVYYWTGSAYIQVEGHPVTTPYPIIFDDQPTT